MADASEEIIGAIGVSITGDYSELKASYSQAQSDAEAAGEAVAGAFNDGVSSISDAADVVTAALDPIGPAADGAGDGLDSFAESASSAGSAAEEAGGGLSSLAEQLTAVGEALVITEGLKELGTEALDAADAITHASIALTTITGSGEQAETTIQGLEQLGMADGLSMPSLLTAATRMQQILGPSADVVTELGSVANGAAIMGTDIATAATKFDQMATAGTASARTLTSLGISLAGLATAFNVVVPGADATSASVAAMFKALDQSQRVDVLNQALSGLGGTAQQVAEQTFGGQWQQLANAWEGIMVQVGQAILPVISDLLDFTKTDIVPFIQGVTSAFSSLADPIKDTVVVVGLAAAALIPLTGGLAALGLAFEGLAGLMPAVTGLLETFGIATEAVGAEAATAAGAEGIAGLGIAAEATEVGIGGLAGGIGALAGVIGVGLVSGLAAAAFGFTDLKASLAAAYSGMEQFSQGSFNTWITAEIAGLKSAQLTTDDAAAATAKFQQALDQGVISAAQYKTAVDNITTAEKSLAAQDMAAITAQYSAGLTILTTNTQRAADQTSVLKQVFTDATNAFIIADAAYKNGTITAEAYQGAVNKVTSAQTAYNGELDASAASMGPIPGSMDAITAAANQLADSTGFVVSAQQQQTNEQTVANSSLDLATEAYNRSATATQLAVAQLNGLKIADDGSIASRQAIIGAEENVQKAYAASQKAQQDLATTQTNWATTVDALVLTAAQKQLSELQDLAAAVGPDIAQFSGLQDKIMALQSTLPAFGVVTVNISTGPLAGLQSALAEASNNVNKFAADMAAGQAVGQQYEKALNAQLTAQINLNVATAEAGTGLQGATDAYSLATIAVAAAQAKLDTLNQAYQTNISLAPQVEAAQKALTAAQNALNTATGQGTTLVDSLSAAYPNLTASVDTATTALAANVTQLQSVAAAVQQVESDIASAVSGLSGATSAASGGTTSNGGFFLANAATLDTEDFNAQTAQAQALMPAKGTSPQALAQDVLAQAQAVLAVDQKFFGVQGTNGVLVNASQLQTAQQAVATAEAALTTVQGGSAGTSTSTGGASGSTGGEQSPIIVSGTLGGTTTTTTGTVSTGSTAGTTSVVGSSGGGTSAIDGGSYQAVTAHQAVGEVWAVTTGAASSGGGGTVSAITETISNTVNSTAGSGDLSSVTGAVGGAVQELASNGQSLLNLATAVAASTTATQQIAEAVAGLVEKIATGSTVSSQPLATATGGSGTAASVGGVIMVTGSGTGNPQGPAAPPVSTPINSVPGYNPFAPGPTSAGTNSSAQQVTINVDARGAIGINTAAMTAQISAVVSSTLVANLRAQGARF